MGYKIENLLNNN